jgi:hypothetical protein
MKGGIIDRATFEQRRSRGMFRPDFTYEEFERLVGEEADRAAERLAELKVRQDAYEADPGAQMVRCDVNPAGDPIRTNMSKDECAAAHAEWERKNHPANYYFFRPAVNALTQVGDVAASALEDIPGIGKVASKVYQGFAPPGSAYYSDASMGEKAVGTAASLFGLGKRRRRLCGGLSTAQIRRHLSPVVPGGDAGVDWERIVPMIQRVYPLFIAAVINYELDWRQRRPWIDDALFRSYYLAWFNSEINANFINGFEEALLHHGGAGIQRGDMELLRRVFNGVSEEEGGLGIRIGDPPPPAPAPAEMDVVNEAGAPGGSPIPPDDEEGEEGAGRHRGGARARMLASIRAHGGRAPAGLVEALEGAGIFGDIWSTAKKYASRVVDVVRHGKRQDYPPRVRELLARIGNQPIVAARLRRDPIKAPLNIALNLITQGRWEQAKRKYAYDKLFHLGLEVTVRVSDSSTSNGVYIIEKNEVINVAPAKPATPDTETLPVDVRGGVTINSLLDGARKIQGANFYNYDAFRNNCQDFIVAVLNGSGLATPNNTAWVKQPVSDLVTELPDYTSKVANIATDIGALANVVLEGRGGATPRSRFAKQLKAAGVSPGAYLMEAQKKAEDAGLAHELLGFSDDDKHKLQIPNHNGTIVRFGAVGLGDHILYTLKGDPQADEHQRRYLSRATKIRGKWREDEYSPNSLAINVLW